MSLNHFSKIYVLNHFRDKIKTGQSSVQCDVIWLHKRGTMKDQKRGKLIQDYQRRVNRVHYGRNDEILIKKMSCPYFSKRLIKDSICNQGGFNNYVDKMSGGRGSKNVCFCPRSGYTEAEGVSLLNILSLSFFDKKML